VSIRVRLAALFTFATLLLVGGGALAFVTQLRSGLENSLDQTLQARAAAVSADLGAAGTSRGPLRTGPNTYGQIYSAAGRLIDTSEPLRDALLLTPTQAVSAAKGGDLHLNRAVELRVGGDVGVESMRVYATATGVDHTVVAVASSRDLVDEALQRTSREMIVLAAAAVILAGPGSWLLARAALRPVERMRAQAARLQADDAVEGITVPPTRDELARLAGTFNALLGRLHAALDRERQFVADAGHELRSPLTVLRGEFELAQRPGRTRDELAETVNVAAEETERLVRLTDNLLALARENDTAPRLRPFDLADVGRDAIAAASSRAAAQHVDLRLAAGGRTQVVGDAERLRQAVDNLVTNALRHSRPGDSVTVRVGAADGEAVICVEDQGPGFSPDFLPVAFHRFTRGDDARGRSTPGADAGNGLGLAIVAAIMTTHNGVAAAGNREGGGAVVTLRWPQPPDGDAMTPARALPAMQADPAEPRP